MTWSMTGLVIRTRVEHIRIDITDGHQIPGSELFGMQVELTLEGAGRGYRS